MLVVVFHSRHTLSESLGILIRSRSSKFVFFLGFSHLCYS